VDRPAAGDDFPEEIKSARRVTNEVERLLEQAREEPSRFLARAQEAGDIPHRGARAHSPGRGAES